jgi:glutamate racemase
MSCVGMLDWGIGGLGCYRLLKQVRPGVPVLYWSDTGAVPYGQLSRRDLTRRLQQVIEKLRSLGASHVLVACNAASTVLDEIVLDLPILGMIGAARAAVPRRLRGTLAVIGGVRTVRSGLHRKLLERPSLRVMSRIAQPLSGHIEAGTTGSAAYRKDLAGILAPLVNANAVLLACTHYPAIATDIQAVLGQGTRLIDPAHALIEQAIARFELVPQTGRDRFLTTGSPSAMRRAAERTWQVTLPRCERVALS